MFESELQVLFELVLLHFSGLVLITVPVLMVLLRDPEVLNKLIYVLVAGPLKRHSGQFTLLKCIHRNCFEQKILSHRTARWRERLIKVDVFDWHTLSNRLAKVLSEMATNAGLTKQHCLNWSRNLEQLVEWLHYLIPSSLSSTWSRKVYVPNLWRECQVVEHLRAFKIRIVGQFQNLDVLGSH